MTLFGFIMAEILRIALGPKRDPERKELAVSNGAPAIAKSSPFAESTLVIRINVPMLQNLGDDNALAGCFTSAILITSINTIDKFLGVDSFVGIYCNMPKASAVIQE